MAKKDDRKITLECTSCKRRNYASTKNRRNTPERMEISKFCPFEKTHKPHKEIK